MVCTTKADVFIRRQVQWYDDHTMICNQAWKMMLFCSMDANA